MSPNKLIVPYLHRVCRHLLWPPYRARVRRELTDHILSRAEELRCRSSLTQEQAVRQVLRQRSSSARLRIWSVSSRRTRAR